MLKSQERGGISTLELIDRLEQAETQELEEFLEAIDGLMEIGGEAIRWLGSSVSQLWHSRVDTGDISAR